METSGYMSDYICSFANISGYVTAHFFACLCNRICNHFYLLNANVTAVARSSEQCVPIAYVTPHIFLPAYVIT